MKHLFPSPELTFHLKVALITKILKTRFATNKNWWLSFPDSDFINYDFMKFEVEPKASSFSSFPKNREELNIILNDFCAKDLIPKGEYSINFP